MKNFIVGMLLTLVIFTVVVQGGLNSLLTTIQHVDELTRLLTLQTIMRMSDFPHSHSIIMNNVQILRYFISLTTNEHDIQVHV